MISIFFNYLCTQALVSAVLFLTLWLFYQVLSPFSNIRTHSVVWFLFFVITIIPVALLELWLPHSKISSTFFSISNEFSAANQIYAISEKQSNNNFLSYTIYAWFVGFSLAFLFFIAMPMLRQRFLIRKMLANSESIDISQLQYTEHFRIKNVVLWESSDNYSPFVSGFIFPVLFLPKSLIKSVCVDTIKSILLHEDAHARSYDNLRNLFSRFITCVFWFSPFMYLAIRSLRQTQELAADHFALSKLDKMQRLAMAKSIALSAEANHTNDTFIFNTAFNNKNDITRRLQMIKGFKHGGFWSVLLAIGVITGSAWTAYAVTAKNPPNLKISGTISKSGKVISKPIIITTSGGAAKIVSGNNSTIFILDMIATYYDPSLVTVEMTYCEQVYHPVSNEDLPEEKCEDDSIQTAHAEVSLNQSFKIYQGDLELAFSIDKIQIIKQ